MPLFPRKRVLLAIHRWMGAAAALFLLLLALTGLVLNHSKTLGLDEIRVQSAFVLKRYGMAASGDVISFRIHELDTVSHLDGSLYFNGVDLVRGGLPVGFLENDTVSLIACPSRIILMTREGELIEVMDESAWPFARIRSLGISRDGLPVVNTDRGVWRMDSQWLVWSPFGDSYTGQPCVEISTPLEVRTAILETYQGSGPTLYKVLLDLHSGRLFGWGGRTVADLTAVAIILLVTSGILGWLRKSRRKRPAG